MVGDISDTMQSPVWGGPGLNVLGPPNPRSKAVALDRGVDGSGRGTGRGVARPFLAEAGSQVPGWRSRRCPGRRPVEQRQGAGRSPPGGRARLGVEGGGRGATIGAAPSCGRTEQPVCRPASTCRRHRCSRRTAAARRAS